MWSLLAIIPELFTVWIDSLSGLLTWIFLEFNSFCYSINLFLHFINRYYRSYGFEELFFERKILWAGYLSLSSLCNASQKEQENGSSNSCKLVISLSTSPVLTLSALQAALIGNMDLMKQIQVINFFTTWGNHSSSIEYHSWNDSSSWLWCCILIYQSIIQCFILSSIAIVLLIPELQPSEIYILKINIKKRVNNRILDVYPCVNILCYAREMFLLKSLQVKFHVNEEKS